MDIIHNVNRSPLPRVVTSSLSERLSVMPAVVVTGARQTGKSTLAKDLTPSERQYYTLDDLDVLDLARRDPEVLAGGKFPVTLDEVQRAPDLLFSVKRAIDRNRQPGQFLLTGSANLLLMSKVSESLAGRASYLTLWPMTRREQLGLGKSGIWEELAGSSGEDWLDIVLKHDTPGDWRSIALRGGFPTPATELKTADERAIWFDGYIRTYLERDLQYLSSIDGLPDFRRLMRAACHRLGGVLNQTELGRDVGLPQPTVHRYLNLLETSYMLVRLPSYSVNRTKRLIKAPKIYWGDTGTALRLAENTKPDGAHLENLILLDMLAWRDSRLDRAEIFYWRTHDGEEVDLVLEIGDRLIPIEIKSGARPRISDTKNLRSFIKEYENRSNAGLLIHTGDATQWITPNVLAVPWWRII
jgi:predicted AAA+ superfamily ATPase